MFKLNSSQPETTCDRRALFETPLFQALPQKYTGVLNAACTQISFRKNETLMVQNDPADWFYFILSGWVKLYRETQDGNEAVVELVGTNSFIGENAFLEGSMYASDATAAEDTVALRLPCSLLREAIANCHGAANVMLQMYANKHQRLTRELESLKLQGTPQRIGCFLLRECKGKPTGNLSVKLPYGKSLIAGQLGMQGETFSRALAKLRKATDVTVKGGQVCVPNITKLAEFVCAGCSNEYPCKDLVPSKHL